ncbi:hypothetical protein SY88_15385 [Clostridiales bacterium PH28_bin88]|nr:hypothetical protein SY88_15385 [Clostridiales bacterium PH28_bin88]
MGKERLEQLLAGNPEVVKGELWVSPNVLEALCLKKNQYSLIELALKLDADCCFFSYSSPLAESDLTSEDMIRLLKEARLKNLGCGLVIDGPFERMIRDQGFATALPLFTPAGDGRAFDLLSEYAELADTELESALRTDTDIILICDDIAYNHGLYMSPVQFHRLLLPFYERMARKTPNPTRLGFHSDGNIEKVLPSLIDLGFNFFSLEPEAMDLVRLKSSLLSKSVLMSGIKAEWLASGWDQSRKEEIQEYVKALQGETGLILSSTCGLFLPSAIERLEQIYNLT